MGCLNPVFYSFLGGQKRAFLGGPKSPILARGHMGKTAVFNQIVLYLETPNLDQNRPSGAKLTPYKKMGPLGSFGCKTHDASPRPSQHACNLGQGLGEIGFKFIL